MEENSRQEMIRGTISTLSPFDTWCIVSTVVKHFTTGYDCIKYNYKMKHLSPANFGRRNDQYFYERLSKKFTDRNDLIKYVVANCIAGETWSGNMTMQPYDELVKKLQSFRYLFSADMKKLSNEDPSFNNWLLASLNFSPKIISKQLTGEINIESVIVIDALTDFLNKENPYVEDSLIWDTTYPQLKKYQPFVCQWVNVKGLKQIILDTFTQ